MAAWHGQGPGHEKFSPYRKRCEDLDGASMQGPCVPQILLGCFVAVLCVAQPSLALSEPVQSSDLLGGLAWTAASFVAGSRLFPREDKPERSESSGTTPLPQGLLNNMLHQTHGAAVLHAVTSTGLMDIMPLPAERPISASQLLRQGQANALDFGCSAAVLQQLLHHLAACNIVDEVDESGEPLYRHTELSTELRKDGRARAFVMVNFSPAQVRPWWRVREAISAGSPNGKNPFEMEHGRGVFEHYSEPSHAEESAYFDELMRELSIAQSDAADSFSTASLVADLPIWADVSSTAKGRRSPVVVDVGGGMGHLLAAILARHQEWTGVLFDRPEVLSWQSVALELRSDATVASRTSLVNGSFFDDIPCIGDVFVLKWILHDWNDLQCHKILGNLRRAMLQGDTGTDSCQRLLIIEQTVPEADDASKLAQTARSSLNDLYLWVLYGGRERRVSEFVAMIEAEGFTLERVSPLNDFRLVAIQCRLNGLEKMGPRYLARK